MSELPKAFGQAAFVILSGLGFIFVVALVVGVVEGETIIKFRCL